MTNYIDPSSVPSSFSCSSFDNAVICRSVKMHWINSVLLAVVVVICVTQLTSAIECYECVSTQNGDCGDPFDDDKKAKAGKCTSTSDNKFIPFPAMPVPGDLSCWKTIVTANDKGNKTSRDPNHRRP